MDRISFDYQGKSGISGILINVKVNSGPFAGSTVFNVIDEYLQEAISKLEKMYETLSGTCDILDDATDYVTIESLKHGHFLVHGVIGGCYNPQYLTFELKIDQTDLKVIISELKTILKAD